ncbi:MAG: hypothetical protein ACTS73_06695 [Arsenophonus sp. NEOnobi-MAG3]
MEKLKLYVYLLHKEKVFVGLSLWKIEYKVFRSGYPFFSEYISWNNFSYSENVLLLAETVNGQLIRILDIDTAIFDRFD